MTVLLQFMRCWTGQSRGDSAVAVHEMLDTKQSRGTVLLQFMRCWTQRRGDSAVAVCEVLDIKLEGVLLQFVRCWA